LFLPFPWQVSAGYSFNPFDVLIAIEWITDLYGGSLQSDHTWRKEWCNRAGLGFQMVGYAGLQNVVPIDAAKAA
jgi:hypothetical protein